MKLADAECLARLQPETISFALWGGYLHKPSGLLLWYDDGMQFMNHGVAGRANVGLFYWPKLADDHIIALRDIMPGEELREDYAHCLDGGVAPEHWLHPFYLAHCPQHYAFLLSLGLLGKGSAAAPAPRPQVGGRKLRTVAMSVSSSTGLESTAPNPEVKHAA
jgi:hypothetical protein